MVNLVSFHMPQHARHSGYSQVARFLKADVLDANKPTLLSRVLPSFIKQHIVIRSGLDWYKQAYLMAECSVILRMFTRRNEIFHFVYGENSFRYSARFARPRGHKLVATYHLPPEIFFQYMHYTKHLNLLDAIICVSSCQVDFFSRFISPDRIVFIPLGVDAEFFRPDSSKPKTKKTCLFVGHMLRDFQTMAEVARIVNSKDKSVRFLVITRKMHFNHFKDVENVTLRADLTDEELLDCYQRAEVLVQPLKYSTANLTTLEAMACGLPVLTNDIGGVRDYLDDNCAVFVGPNNPQLMAEKLLELLDSPQRLARMSAGIRGKSLNFRWQDIAKRLEEFYRIVASW